MLKVGSKIDPVSTDESAVSVSALWVQDLWAGRVPAPPHDGWLGCPTMSGPFPILPPRAMWSPAIFHHPLTLTRHRNLHQHMWNHFPSRWLHVNWLVSHYISNKLSQWILDTQVYLPQVLSICWSPGAQSPTSVQLPFGWKKIDLYPSLHNVNQNALLLFTVSHQNLNWIQFADS